jgi:hypothetical protein
MMSGVKSILITSSTLWILADYYPILSKMRKKEGGCNSVLRKAQITSSFRKAA